MKVFKISRGYRKFGLGMGLPFFFIEMDGIGPDYTPEDLISKLGDMGLDIGGWVVLKGSPLNERSTGVLVKGLRFCRVNVEVEEGGNKITPGWFMDPNRWIIRWIEGGRFNYGVLRARQDMLVYEGKDIEGFLEKTKDCLGLKVAIVDEPEEVWEQVKDHEVRVYRREILDEVY